MVQHVVKKLQASGRLSEVTRSMPAGSERSEVLKSVGTGADLALLLTNGVAPDPLYQTNQVMRGFGVFQRTALGMKLNSLPHAAIKAELVDLKSGETIATYTTSSFELQKYSLGAGAAIDADKVEMVQQSLTRLTDQASNELLKTFGFQ
jgi:long-subunit fatty acid transport protein